MTDIEQRASELASGNGWWWPTLGETGRLGREGWRDKARTLIEQENDS